MSELFYKKDISNFRTYTSADCVSFLKTNEIFGGLSNMAGGYTIFVNEIKILTTEALYQACRFPYRPDIQKIIIEQTSPIKAKMKSKHYLPESRRDWLNIRIKIMKWCLRVKLANNWEKFSSLLLSTKSKPIVEISYKSDFWGAKPIDNSQFFGMNVLGRLLMELREEIKLFGKDYFKIIFPLSIPDFLLYEKKIGIIRLVESEQFKNMLNITQKKEKNEEENMITSAQASLFDGIIETTNSIEYSADVRIIPKKRMIGFDKYKFIEIPWIKKIPRHWELLPNRALFFEVIDRNHPNEEMLSVTIKSGVIKQNTLLSESSKKDSSNLDKNAYKLVQPGDIAYNKMRAWQGALGVSTLQGIVSPAYIIMRPRIPMNSKYYHYLMRIPAFNKEVERWSYGITSDQWSLRSEHFRMIYCPYPSLEEQNAIVRFLDYTDTRIKRYIRAKQKLIKLLNEQKQAIIHQAVTRGLDPNVPLKPSGVEWLGDIPEHWKVRRLRNVVTMFVSNVDKHIKENEFPVRLCNYVDVYKNEKITNQLNFMAATATAEEIQQFLLKKEDVLITKDSEMWNDIGVPALVEYTALDLICGYHLAILRPRENEIYGRYLFRLLQNQRIAIQFHVSANGVTRYGLSQSAIKNILLPIPPLKEQISIYAFINKYLEEINTAIEKSRLQISLLQEYRTRLIADVVTGKLDVREAANQLPEELEEIEPELEEEILSEEDPDFVEAEEET